MKKVLIIISFFLVCLVNSVDAANIRAVWSVASDTTWVWYWWKLVFPANWSWVFVNNDNYLIDNTSDLQISWNFWLSNISTTLDPSLWWVTFDIWTVAWASKVTLKNNLDNTFIFNWYAWSKWAWWIYFSPTNLITGDSNSKVVYNRTTWIISWCAWSQNLGWICFDWITLDMTPPDLTNMLKPTAANNNKSFILSETWTVEIENYNSSSLSTYSNVLSFTHDIRNVKNYYIKVTDLSWNVSTWLIQVVANIPSDSTSIYSWTLWTDKIADWADKHNIHIELKDAYWNSVIPVSWVKNVSVTLWFDNNLDFNQVWTEYNLWDAIIFSNNDFIWLFWWVWDTQWTANNTLDWKYNLSISSYAPSTFWYTYTSSNNDISVNNLNINITALNWNSWVWEIVNLDKKSNYSDPFKFSPVVKVNWVQNSNNWNISRDNETSFTWVISVNKTAWSSDIENIQVTHILDVMSWSIYKNDYLSFQNIIWYTGASICRWNNTSTWYYYSNISCNQNSPNKSSNIIRDHWDKTSSTTINDLFKATPRIVNSWLSKFDTKYSSEISYNIDWKNINYKSYYATKNSAVTNNEVKIAWIVNKNNNNFSVVSDSSINYIWNITKSDVYTLVHKNVSKYQKTWTWWVWVMYKKWDYTLNSWPVWVDTIIVDWGDLLINDNIYKIAWKVRTIISLKNSNWSKWNIWINNNVQFIWATLIADRSVISWNLTAYYSDLASSINQLFIKWSVISYNTIWWSSKSPSICPFYINKSTCDLQTAKRYDFNHFRSYINWVQWSAVNWSTYWVNISLSWYSNAPMIIEYDSDIQKYPPSILKTY